MSLTVWYLASLPINVAVILAFFHERKKDPAIEPFNKDDIGIVIAMFVAGPLTCAVITYAAISTAFEARVRRKARTILHTCYTTDVGYEYADVLGEYKLSHLKEDFKTLSDEDIKFLLSLSKSVYEIDEHIYKAISDEMMEREMLRKNT